MTKFPTHDPLRIADLDLAVRLGHISTAERSLLLHYRMCNETAQASFTAFVESLPRIWPR